MTDNYRSELFSRIRKLNFSNARMIGQAFRLFLLFLLFFALFGGIGYLIDIDNEAKKTIGDFFCQRFTDASFSEHLRRVLSFSSSDFYLALLILISGYTMLSVPVSLFCLSYMGAKSGFCFSWLWKILIGSDALSGGGATFAYLAICKLCVLVAIIFIALCAQDFSYRYSDIYRRSSRPITSSESANYIMVTLSSAGVTILINLLFFIFQHISPSTYI